MGFVLKSTIAFLVLTFAKGSCSVVELNATVLASIPALYGLDDWSQCRRETDVYCVVDAELRARTPRDTEMLQFLQEYSKQTLKHYNRTLIHRGVCVSQCGNTSAADGWSTAAKLCLDRTLDEYGLESEIVSVSYCTNQPSPGGARALCVVCVVLIALTLVQTTLHVLCDKCAQTTIEGNRYLLAFSLKRNWRILTYDRSKPRTDMRMKDIACMEGFRFLGMQCVIFSHVIFISVYSYIDNPQFVEKMYDQFGWQAVLNSPLWLQAFFSLSGFLTAYSTLVSSENSPVNFVKCLISIVNRWIRITPLSLFALWFTIAWFPVLGSGPQWGWLAVREAHDCSERWWHHLLYTHNHLPLGKLCMGHTWYLAVDMQLHVVGIFVVLLLVKFRRAAAPVLGSLVAGSAIAAGVVVYLYQLTPIITAQSPESLRTMFLGSGVMSYLYLPSWMNLPGYFGGVAVAFILYHCQEEGIKLQECKWFNILFHSSLTLGGCVVLTGVIFLSDTPPPLWAAAVYSALDRTLVAVFFNVFMLGCVSRCKSAFRSALDWRGFHTLGRLSFCAFLVHFIVLRLTLAGNTQLGHPTILSLISLQITASVLTYMIAVPLCLLIELPAIELWKALTERERPSLVAPAHNVTNLSKSFDLVAHVRRRIDVNQ